jgi:DDE domain
MVFSHEAVREWESKLTPALAEEPRRRRKGRGVTPKRVTTDGHDSYPRAIRTELGKDVRHRTNRYRNNGLEQGHRGLKGRYRSQVPQIGCAVLSRMRRAAQPSPSSQPSQPTCSGRSPQTSIPPPHCNCPGHSGSSMTEQHLNFNAGHTPWHEC